MVRYFIIMPIKLWKCLNNDWKETWKNKSIWCEYRFIFKISSWVMSIFFCSNDTFLCETQFRVCSRGLGAKVPPMGAPWGLGDCPPQPGPGLDLHRDWLREISCICRGPLRGYCWPSGSLKELLESSERFPRAKGSMDYRPFSTNQRFHWMRQPLLRCPCVQGNRDVLRQGSHCLLPTKGQTLNTGLHWQSLSGLS